MNWVLLWFCVLKSGVHATLAGATLALTIPVRGGGDPEMFNAPMHRLEHDFHPRGGAFLVLLVFGFANAGVSWPGVNLVQLTGPVPLGIAAGLLLGMPGVFGFSWLAVRLGLMELPTDMRWKQATGPFLHQWHSPRR